MLKSKKSKIIAIIIATLVCAGVGVGYGFLTSNKTTTENQEMQQTVSIEQYYIPDEEKIFVNGTVIPRETKKFFINPEQGVLDTMSVEDEQQILEGEALYTCRNDSVLEQIDELKSQITKKEKEKANLKKEQVDMKKSIDLEISTMKEAIVKLDEKVYSTVYAPFNGVVYLTKSNDDNSSEPLMILDSSEFYINGKVNEYDSVKLSTGQEVEVLFFATKEKITGKIESIADRPNEPSGDSKLSEYEVKIAIENKEKFKNGMSVQATAKFVQDSIKVPVSSVISENEKNYVFKIENDIARKTEVNVLEKTDEYIVVNSGVKNGESIVKNLDMVTVNDGQNIYESGSGTQSPGTNESGTPETETPGTETPGTETPGTETPETETPGTETPETETPETETPGTEIPVTETP